MELGNEAGQEMGCQVMQGPVGHCKDFGSISQG